VLTGEAGVGKSRLTEEARGRAEALDIRWLQTRCLSYGAGLPYWPYAELVRTAGASERPFFARLAGALETEEVSRLEPEAFRRGLHDAFASWFSELAGERPTVLVVEDLHWADASTQALTAELAPLGRDMPFTLFLIARREARDTLLGLAPGAQTIDLAPLGVDAVEQLIAEDRMRPAFLFEACRVRRLDEATLLADPALAALDPGLDSVLNLNERSDYEDARSRPAPEVTVQRFGALRRMGNGGPDPAVVQAATLGEAAAASGLTLDEHIVAALNGDQMTRDPEAPLATGDTVAFLSADAGG
jgi:hypothetical protein